MGPIERELRTAPVENEAIYYWCLSDRAARIVRGAWPNGFGDAYDHRVLPDVLSDAIEFAASEGI